MNNAFSFDIILPKQEICNHAASREKIWEIVTRGERLVLFGRRNTGKTSIVKSDILQRFSTKHKKGIAVFVDAMDTDSEEDFCSRLQKAFAEAIVKSGSSQALMTKVVHLMKHLRLSLSIDPLTNIPSLELALGGKDSPIAFEKTLALIAEIHKDHNALLVIDEFQDISLVKSLAAKLRSNLQNFPADLPVIVLGSKKHLLSKMFADPRAPFASWGQHMELPPITAVEYHKYIENRFEPYGLKIKVETTQFLMEELQFIPEPINIVCHKITKQFSLSKVISNQDVLLAINAVVEERSSLFRERLHRYTEKEIRFLKTLACMQPIAKPLAKDFVGTTRLSVGGIQAIVSRLENDAMIYRLDSGYVVNDPLLQRFLTKI